MKTFISQTKYLPAVVFWLALWHFASLAIAHDIILVSPIAAIVRLFQLSATLQFWASIGTSLARIVLGFVFSLILGVLIAGLTAKYNWLYTLFLPAVSAIKAVPVASFTILAILWIGTANLSVFIAFVTVFPIAFFNTYSGVKNTDTKLLEMSRIFCVPLRRVVLKIYVPAVLPHVISAAASGLGFAFKAGIAAEIIGLARGTIGFSLHTARVFLQTADVLAWTIAIVLLSFVIEKIFAAGLKGAQKWL